MRKLYWAWILYWGVFHSGLATASGSFTPKTLVSHRASQVYEAFLVHGMAVWITELGKHLGSGGVEGLYPALRESLVPNPWDSQQQRLDRIFTELKPHIPDSRYRSCIQPLVLELPYAVALSTGCRIFISRDYLQGYGDLEIAFIMAHEIGHSLRGDGIMQTLYRLRHFGYSKSMRKSELTADAFGARLLRAAGYSDDDAELAILNLEFVDEDTDLDESEGDHPSIRERLRAVQP